jgi:hypothetical protein
MRPLQICAMSDGAHGERKSWPAGQVGIYSIVLGRGGYSDVDEGNIVRYCGASGACEEAHEGGAYTSAYSSPVQWSYGSRSPSLHCMD